MDADEEYEGLVLPEHLTEHVRWIMGGRVFNECAHADQCVMSDSCPFFHSCKELIPDLTEADWDLICQRRLDELGITYAELRDRHLRGVSTVAEIKLWMLISACAGVADDD